MKANPFDEFDISPGSTLEEITSTFRERAEDASEDERRRLRTAWESLTLHPRGRLVSALLTFPARERVAPPIAAGPLPVAATPLAPPLVLPSLAHLVPRPGPVGSSLPAPLDDELLVGDALRPSKGPSR